jgi:hypothetical protein
MTVKIIFIVTIIYDVDSSAIQVSLHYIRNYKLYTVYIIEINSTGKAVPVHAMKAYGKLKYKSTHS